MVKKIEEYRFFKDMTALPFVEGIRLFGSRARGDGTERSDIDLAILCPAATAGDWQKILDIAENADTLLNIDCVRLDTEADARLRAAIDRDGIVIYKKAKA